MASPAPYKPDERERTRYYYGFAGTPKLVARTSSNQWSEPTHLEGQDQRAVPTPKFYLPIVDRELSAKWSQEVTTALLEAIRPCRWRSAFPIRIGLRRGNEPEMATDNPPEVQTVLLITVEPDSLEWEQGIAIALNCRQILQGFDISDVEVEIREG